MKRIYIHHNNNKKSISEKDKLVSILKSHGLRPTRKNPDLVIVIGGDGTMLSGIRALKHLDIPFLGINTGSLGFLPSLLPKDIENVVQLLKESAFTVHEYPMLEVESTTVTGDLVRNYAFNEIMIKHQQPRLMEALIYLDGKPFNYFTGDGFIISTPVGTTGYAIWAGGAAIHSDLPVYQITPLNPNDNRINRPLKTSMIVPLETKIEMRIVKAERRAVMVACDGKSVSDDFIAELKVSTSEKTIKILRIGEDNYFELFRQKIIDKNIYRYLDE